MPQLMFRKLQSAERSGGSFLGWVFVVVGLVVFGVSAWSLQDGFALLRDGKVTQAKVTRVTQAHSRDNQGKQVTRSTAVIHYHVDMDEYTLTREWTVRDSGECGYRCYLEGQSLKVIYVPDEPRRATVHSQAELFGTTGTFALAGFFFAVIGVLVILHQRRQPPPPESWQEMRDLFDSIKRSKRTRSDD